jgi:hypothetical protein
MEELQDVKEHLPKIRRVAETYHFVTDWRFQAPLHKVWSVVLDIEHYPGWWKNFRRVKITRGDGKSVGSVIECEVRGSLPYSLNYALEVTEADEFRHILLRSTGDLVGVGRWEFSEAEPGIVKAVYYWDVRTTNPILNLIAPLAKGALARNHERVMANGFAALQPHVEGSAAMNFEEDFVRRHPTGVEKRGGSNYIAFDIAGAFIDDAEHSGIGILGMDGFLIGKLTYPALSRIADFSRAGEESRPDFVAWSCRQARAVLAGPWRSPPAGAGAEDQIHPEATGRYMIDFTLTKKSPANPT